MKASVRTMAGLIALAGLAQAADAQVRWREGPSAPSGGGATTYAAPAEGGGRTTVRTITRVGDDRTVVASGTTDSGRAYEITVKNDDVTAKVDGKKVPDDRIRLSDDTVEVLDERGNVIVTVSIAEQPVGDVEVFTTLGGRGGAMSLSPGRAWVGGGGQSGGTVSISQAAPKVMVGINMSDVDPVLREHFGLAEDAGFVVDNVLEGLPADKAGIKARDVVISVDGKNVTSATLRDALKDKEPGQRVRVKILRKGETREVEMELAAYDASKLGVAMSPMAGVYGRALSPFGNEAMREEMEAAQKALEEAMGSLRGDSGAMKDAREQIERAMRELETVRSLRMQGLDNDQFSNLFVIPTPPAPPAPPAAGSPSEPTPPASAREPQRRYQVMRDPLSNDRTAAIEERLNKLDERLNQLDSRIERLLERLERDN